MFKLSTDELIRLFKLKMYFGRLAGLTPFPVLDAQNFFRPPLPNVFVFPGKTSFTQLSSSELNRSLFFLLFSLKLRLFRTNFNFSRFTTKKFRVVDNRYNPPKLTEFNFNLEGPNVLMLGLNKAKLAINYFVNSVDFYYKFFKKFSKTFLFKKLQPYQKLSTFLFKKFLAKRLGFVSYISSLSSRFSILFFNLARLTILSLLLQLRARCLPMYFFKLNPQYLSNAFLPFFVLTSVTKLSSVTGLVIFVKPNTDLFNFSTRGSKKTIGIRLVRHFGHYYPFTPRETLLPGASSIIPPWRAGKVTFFFFNTKRMLKRKFKNQNLFTPIYSDKIFPRTPFRYIIQTYNEFPSPRPSILQLSSVLDK